MITIQQDCDSNASITKISLQTY